MGNTLTNSSTMQNISLENFARDQNAQFLLDKPLADFYVNTSHNSFLDSTQILGNPSTVNVVNCLNMGARCIEIDIHKAGKLLSVIKKNIPDSDPIIAHGNDSIIADISYASINNVFSGIAQNAFKNTNDPLIIYFELFNYDDGEMMSKLRNAIIKYFKDRLYSGTLNKVISNNLVDDYFINTPIRNLLGKICIVVNYNNASVDKYLSDLYHGTTQEPSNGYFNGRKNKIAGVSSNDAVQNQINRVTRVYPYNTALSTNYNPEKYWNCNYTFVALNFGNNDNNLKINALKFKYLNFVPKDFIISKDGKLIKSNGLYMNVPLFQGGSDNGFLKSGFAYFNNYEWVNGDYKLIMQSDGNLVIYKNGSAKWHSGTHGNPNAVLRMQSDGNLVIYVNQSPKWSSNTFGNENGYAGLGNNGTLYLMKSSGEVIRKFN